MTLAFLRAKRGDTRRWTRRPAVDLGMPLPVVSIAWRPTHDTRDRQPARLVHAATDPTRYQMMTPPPTLTARRAAPSMFPRRREIAATVSPCVSCGRPGSGWDATASMLARNNAHLSRNPWTSFGETVRSAPASTGKYRAPKARTASDPQTAARQYSHPASSAPISGVSSTSGLLSSPTTNTCTDRVTLQLDHVDNLRVHQYQTAPPGTLGIRRRPETGAARQTWCR